jgi:hypothetical protein
VHASLTAESPAPAGSTAATERLNPKEACAGAVDIEIVGT